LKFTLILIYRPMPRFQHTAVRAAAAAAFTFALACAADAPPGGDATAASMEQHEDSLAEAADDAAPAVGEIPAGGLEDWIADVRRGLERLPAAAAADPAGAQHAALDLYVGRQEYIELFYGPRGRLTAGETLGPAVERAEERFHELLLLLGGSEPPDSAQVRKAVAAVEAEYDRVLEEAVRAGVPLMPASAPAAH